MKGKRVFSEDFKRDVVQKVMTSNRSTVSVCREVGILPKQYYYWRDRYFKGVDNPRKRVFQRNDENIDYSTFQTECKELIKDHMDKLFNKWKETDLISRIKTKLNTPEKVEETSRKLGISPISLNDFLNRKNNSITFEIVNRVIKYTELTI